MANQRQKKGKAEHHDAFSLLFDCVFDKVLGANRRNGTHQKAAVKLAGQLGKTERYGIMGT